jgi:hypothetical protein
MSVNKLVLIAGLAALVAAVSSAPSLAQTAQGSPYPPRPRHARPRIEVTPRPLLYRRCVERLELQYRPSGTVLFPRYRCWWVRG